MALKTTISSGILITIIYAASMSPGALKLTDNTPDAGLNCFMVETDAATFYLDKVGAGLSSIVDKNGKDWLSFNDPGGTQWNGFPNAVYSGLSCNPL